MRDQWQYQVRIDLADELALAARRDLDDPALKPLADILARHDAALTCQFDAFAGHDRGAGKAGKIPEIVHALRQRTGGLGQGGSGRA